MGIKRHAPTAGVVSVIGPDLADRQSADDRVRRPDQRRENSSRIGFAQADCMSPALGAVASVMNIFAGLDNGREFASASWPEASATPF